MRCFYCSFPDNVLLTGRSYLAEKAQDAAKQAMADVYHYAHTSEVENISVEEGAEPPRVFAVRVSVEFSVSEPRP